MLKYSIIIAVYRKEGAQMLRQWIFGPEYYEELKGFLIFFAGAAVCLYLVYAVAVALPYVAHDSVRDFEKFFNPSPRASIHILRGWAYGQGRPVGAEIESFIFKNVNQLTDLSRVRGLVVLVLALCAAWLGRFAVSRGFARIPAFCLATAIFTLPGIQESVFVPYLFHAMTVLFAFIAYMFWSSRGVFALRLIGAMVFLEIAFLTYTADAFFFLIPTVLVLIREDDGIAAAKVALRDITLCLAAALLYYVIVKLFFYKGAELSSGYQLVFSLGHVGTRILALAGQALPRVFNFWNIYYAPFWGGIAALAVAGVWGAACHVDKKSGALMRALALVAILVTANMIWFVSRQEYIPRSFAVTSALCLLVTYEALVRIAIWRGMELVTLARVLAGAVLMLGLVNAHVTVVRNAWNLNAELMFVRSRVLPYMNPSITEIRVIQPRDPAMGFNGFPSTSDQFNSPTTGVDFEIPDLVRSVLVGVLRTDDQWLLSITMQKYDDPVLPPSPHRLIVDMNELAAIGRWGK